MKCRSVYLAAVLVVWTCVAGGQNIPRIGYLATGAPQDSAYLQEAFMQGLRERGYVEGKTILVERRFADRNPERLQGLAAELLRQNVNLIVAETTPAVRAAKQATSSVPIVMTAVADAVGSGLVASLARPGGNVTGLSFLGTELVAKRLEVLREAVPAANRIVVLWHPGAHGEGTVKRMREETESAARTMGVTLHWMEARGRSDLEKVLPEMKAQKFHALLLWPSPMFLAERHHIVELAAKNQVPAVYYVREYAEAGGLLSYGHSQPDLFRRAATYVDRILKGAKPAELPVEQPSKFELVVNLKAAQRMHLTIPKPLVLRADHAIE
jgi:putative tryptophan/tyrosine transport system substrate-binding protein